MIYKIYKITCKNPMIKGCYIGSTNNFSTRKSHHKKNCTNRVNKRYWLPLYQFIRANGGWDNFEMCEVETLDCDRKDALTRERHYIDIMATGGLNINKPVGK